MKIETIRLKNFKSFRELELKNLPELAVFVGANGTGKSTLFDVFGFLSDALRNNVRQALQRRGGFKEVRSRGSEGLIEIELQFRLMISGKMSLVKYLLKLGEEGNKIYIERESLKYQPPGEKPFYNIISFSRGEGHIFNHKSWEMGFIEPKRTKLQSPDILAIKGFGQFEEFEVASALRDFIEKWHVSDFHISEARSVKDAGYAEHLSSRGENLALVAQYIFENHPDTFRTILEKMKQRVPGITHVEAETTVDGRIVLKFQDGSFQDPFIARYVSDGTIKMFAYLILLHDPSPHPLLCIEEPENQLYPSLLEDLLEEFRLYANRGGQVFVTSHDPDLVNAAKPQEVYWLVKENGYTTIKRASEDTMIKALVEAGDKLGYLWRQGYFTNSNPK